MSKNDNIINLQPLCFVLDMPHGNSFVGGVASMVNQYLAHKETFNTFGIDPQLLDLSQFNIKVCKSSKINNVINMFRQKSGAKKFFKSHRTSFLHVHSSIKWTLFKDLFIIFKLRNLLKGKIALTIHHAEPSNFFFGKIGEKVGLKIIRKYVSNLIVLSEKTSEYFQNRGIDKQKILTLYTFHSFDNEPVQLDNTVKEDLVFMGAITRWKGIYDLLDALSLCKNNNAKLHLCGSFQDKETEYYVLNHQLYQEGRILYHGYVNGEEKQKILRSSSVFVLPSIAEGMPVSIMEAMACGCAILSTKVGAIPEIIGKENGILIEPHDVKGLSEAIDWLLQNSNRLKKIQDNNLQKSRQYGIVRHIQTLSSFLTNANTL